MKQIQQIQQIHEINNCYICLELTENYDYCNCGCINYIHKNCRLEYKRCYVCKCVIISQSNNKSKNKLNYLNLVFQDFEIFENIANFLQLKNILSHVLNLTISNNNFLSLCVYISTTFVIFFGIILPLIIINIIINLIKTLIKTFYKLNIINE